MIFATCITAKRLVCRIYKKCQQNNKKKTILYKNSQSASTDISQKRKHKCPLNDNSNSVLIKRKQNENTVICHFILIKLIKTWKYWLRYKPKETLRLYWWAWIGAIWKIIRHSLVKLNICIPHDFVILYEFTSQGYSYISTKRYIWKCS